MSKREEEYTITAGEAKNALENIKNQVPDGPDHDAIVEKISGIVARLDVIIADKEQGGEGTPLGTELSEHIKPRAIAPQVNLKWANDLEWKYYSWRNEVSELKKHVEEQVETYKHDFLTKQDCNHKILIIIFLTIAVVLGLAAIVLVIISKLATEKIILLDGVDAQKFAWEAELLATVLGLCDFVIGVLGFCVERISDINNKLRARNITVKAMVTKRAIDEINGQNNPETVTAIDKRINDFKQATETKPKVNIKIRDSHNQYYNRGGVILGIVGFIVVIVIVIVVVLFR